MFAPTFLARKARLCLIAVWLCSSSCYTYRLATHAQPATDALKTNRKKAYSLFWGLINNPQVISTPSCDAMSVNGVAEVSIHTSFGNAFLTIATLGIYCPVWVEWKCAKPCAQSDTL